MAMQIDINRKASQLCEFMIVMQPCQRIPLDILNQLFSKINSLISLLNNSDETKLPDETMKMFYDFLDELKLTLEKIVNEDNGLFSHLKKLFSGSNLNHLKSLISKLDSVYQRVVTNLSILKIQTLNSKRKIPQSDEDDLEGEQLEKNETGYKKVKVALEERNSTLENNPQMPFSIKLVYDLTIQQYITEENKIRQSCLFDKNEKICMTFKREEFLNLPNEILMRLSKEHCVITAIKKNRAISYELKDLSLNGIFYLGNSFDKIKNRPRKLSKLQDYSLKHGDCIGLLMKKETSQEMLLGFEFLCHNSS